MIQLHANDQSVNAAVAKITAKVKQLELIVSPISLTEISKAVFTITTKRFLKDLSVMAVTDPKKYSHLYEWGENGKPSGKLFIMKRARVQYGELVIEIIPLQSTKPVPIPMALSEPGATGKFVSARSIFRNKMEIMEEDTPIHIFTKKTIVFSPDGTNLVFVPEGKAINVMHPGGMAATHALRNFSQSWYATRAESVISSSQIINKIANSVAKVVNTEGSSPMTVYSAIRSVSETYGSEITQL